jgi:hypothetical protein
VVNNAIVGACLFFPNERSVWLSGWQFSPLFKLRFLDKSFQELQVPSMWKRQPEKD